MTQRANPKTGCLTMVVRRLLCSGSRQTHPSNNILDSDETLQLLIPCEEIEEVKKSETQTQNDDVSLRPPPPPPNVVAKLMGLDHTLPGSNRFRYFDDSGSVVTRSKSVNFMDYILRDHHEEQEEEEGDDNDGQRRCRRVKASVSFREIVPTSARLSLKNQQKKYDFLLLYLDKLDEKRELVRSSSFSRSRRFDEKVLEDPKKPPLPLPTKKKENEKVAKKFKDEPRKVAKKKSENRSDVGAKKVRWFLSPSKTNSSEKTALLGGEEGGRESKNIPVEKYSGKESESPENTSPVSVLDRDLYDYLIFDDDYYFSGDSETETTKSSCSSSPGKTRTSTKKESNNNDSEETEFITKLMNMLSDLSEEDMKSSTWVSTLSAKPLDFTQVEDFCVEFGQEILDLVMDQLVDELCI